MNGTMEPRAAAGTPRVTEAARDLAMIDQVPEYARALLLRVDDAYYLALVPAGHEIDLEAAGDLLGKHPVERASDAELAQAFPEAPHGVVPAYGTRQRLATVADIHLLARPNVCVHGLCDACQHEVSLEDFIRQANPSFGLISSEHRGQ